MGKSSSPDYRGAAVAQGEANREVVRDQTFANRPNQYTPWGSIQWNPQAVIDPATGERTIAWDQVQQLDPRLQSILDKQIAIQSGRSDVAGLLTNRLGTEFGTPMNWAGLNPMGEVPIEQFTLPEPVQRELSMEGAQRVTDPTQVMSSYDTSGMQGIANPLDTASLDYNGVSQVADPYQTRQSAEDAVYSQAMSRLQPRFDSQRKQLETKLRNQGLRPGDEQWRSQMQSLGRTQNDAVNQALWSANQAGRQEAGQMFGQQMARREMGTGERDRLANFYNQSAAQRFGQSLAARGQQFGEAGQMADLYNRANSQAFDQSSGLRSQQLAEALARANFGNQASQQVYDQARQANQQNFGQAMQRSAYANQIRQQQLTEAMQRRGFSLNEINALMSGQQVQTPQMPNFSQAAQAAPAPIYQGAVDQGNFNAASQQSINNLVSGLAGAGAIAYGGL